MDRAQDAEGIPQRQIPPQLAPLTEYHADLAGQPAPLRHRTESAGAYPATARHQNAGDQLDRGGLARTVGSDVAHRLTGMDAGSDLVHRAHDPLVAAEPAGPDPHDEVPAEVGQLNDRLH